MGLMSNTLRDLRIDFVSLVKQGADTSAHIRLAKAAPEPTVVTTNPATPIRALPAGKEAHVAKELSERVAKAFGEDHGFELSDEQIEALNALHTEPEPTSDPDPAPTPADPTPADPTPDPDDDGVNKAIEPIAKELADVRKELADERDTRGIAEAVAKARTDYAGLAVDHEAIGTALYRMGKGTATSEDVALMTATLAGASEQSEIAKLATPIGFDGEAPDGTAASVVSKGADAYMAEDPNISRVEARVKAAKSPAGRAAYELAQQ